jgi:hypothetical protein
VPGQLSASAALTQPQESRSASPDAFMWAIASIVTIGLTPEAVGNVEASQTTTFRTPQTSPSGSQAELLAEPPMRADPIWWNENRLNRAGPYPAASAARM